MVFLVRIVGFVIVTTKTPKEMHTVNVMKDFTVKTVN